MRIRVTSQFTVHTVEDLDRHIDHVMAALIAIEQESADLSGVDVSATLAKRLIDISAVVSANSWAEADSRAEEAFTSAIRRAGGTVLEPDEESESGLVANIRSTEMIPA